MLSKKKKKKNRFYLILKIKMTVCLLLKTDNISMELIIDVNFMSSSIFHIRYNSVVAVEIGKALKK